MIPSDVKSALFHALRFKLEFENRRTDEKANSLMSKAMAKRYAEHKRQTEQAIAWLEAQPTEPKFKFADKVFLLGDGSKGHVIKMVDADTVQVCWEDGVVLDEMASVIALQPTEQD